MRKRFFLSLGKKRRTKGPARIKSAGFCACARLFQRGGAFAFCWAALAAANAHAIESFWTQDVWSDPERPFLFYGIEKEQEKAHLRAEKIDEAQRLRASEGKGLEELETLEALQAEVKKRLDRAVMQPTAQNMTAYLEANAFLIEKAGRFAESWRSALLQAPHFDWTAQHPTVNFASTELSRLAARKIEETARGLKDDWGFIFFGDDSDLTRMMLPLVESFSERNGFNTVYVSMIDKNPLMPEARRDRGQASVMAGGIRLFPALVAVRRGDKDPRQARLLATGVVDLAELSRRLVRLALGEKDSHYSAPIKSAEGFAQAAHSLSGPLHAKSEAFTQELIWPNGQSAHEEKDLLAPFAFGRRSQDERF